jgi:hypothetical protein
MWKFARLWKCSCKIALLVVGLPRIQFAPDATTAICGSCADRLIADQDFVRKGRITSAIEAEMQEDGAWAGAGFRPFAFWDRISALGGTQSMTKRTGFLQLEEIPLNKVGLSIRAYGKKKNYVCRVEINHARLAAFTGPKGKKCIANLSWEKLFAQLSTRKPRNGR